MRRALAGLILLWFFQRFDPYAGVLVYDGGHLEQPPCEEQAATHGYFTRLISSRPETKNGKVIGYWRVACFEGPESLRGTSAITVNVR